MTSAASGSGMCMSCELSSMSLRFLVYFSTGTNPVVAICGGKNVGKSSLARILVNTLLNR